MQAPLVSVVIPARNAGASIADTIAAILAQDYDGPIEIVVADGSTDGGTRRAVERFGDAVTVVDNPSGTTPDGLNRAIAASSGEIIARCDAHAVFPSDYIRTAVSSLEANEAAVNVGGVQAPDGRSPFQRAVAIAQSTPLGVGDARYRLGGTAGPVDTVYLGVFRRDPLIAVGGFDPAFQRNQDYELNWRLRQAGGVIWFDPRLRVAYTPRTGVRSLARQYFEYGRWKRHMLRLHPSSVRLRQLAAPALVIGLGVSALLSVTPARPWSLAVPGVYAAAVGATSVAEGIRRGTPTAALLPVVIPTMHLAWGLGFLLPWSPASGDAPDPQEGETLSGPRG